MSTFRGLVQRGGVSEKTTLDDVVANVDTAEIIRAAVDGNDNTAEIVSVESVTASTGSMLSARTGSVSYRITISLSGFVGSAGGTVDGTVVYLLTSGESSFSYTVESSSVIVRAESSNSSISATISGFTGSIQGITITDNSVTISGTVTVEQDERAGQYEAGGETVTEAGKNNTGEGTAQNPYIINTADDFANIDSYGDNVYLALGSDIEGQTAITSKGVVLDLNGHDIEYESNPISVINNGELTINGNGTVTVTAGNKTAALHVYAGGKATVNGGSFVGKTNLGLSVGQASGDSGNQQFSDGLLVINDGSVTAQEFCVGVYGPGELIINGGTFSSIDNAVIGTNGTLITGAGQGEDYYGEDDDSYPAYRIEINGGTFNGNIKTSGYIACDIYMANKGDVYLNGGTFNITNGIGVLVRSGWFYGSNGVTINLNNDENSSAGTVGDKILEIDPADGYIVQDNVSPNYKGAHPYVVTNDTGYTVKILSDTSSQE